MASEAQIKAAYRKAALLHHPDKQAGLSGWKGRGKDRRLEGEGVSRVGSRAQAGGGTRGKQPAGVLPANQC